MSTQGITNRLCTLAETQLQIQAARSATLDTVAIGVMTVDAALAAIVIDTSETVGMWIAALTLLALALVLAIQSLRLPGAAEPGPSVAAMRRAREVVYPRELEEWLLNDLAEDVRINRESLARKASLFDRALTFLVIALVVELAGRLG